MLLSVRRHYLVNLSLLTERRAIRLPCLRPLTDYSAPCLLPVGTVDDGVASLALFISNIRRGRARSFLW